VLVEWVAATSMYVALLMLFTHLVGRARASESTLGLVAFGFFWIVFAGGLLVSAVNVLRSLRAPASKAQMSATN
jgi:succinate-acetate transporter protein